MAFVLGIDIGMSYTAAAIGRRGPDGAMTYDRLELGTRKAAVPTVVALGDDGDVVVGEPAERHAIGHPDRVVREFKRRIGDETPMIVGDLHVAAEDVFAVLAQWVVERAEAHEGEAPAAIAVSHPASWGDHRLDLVRRALAGVGLGGVELVSEPEAAGLHYLAGAKVEPGETIAVYDLGGGTFDVAVLRRNDDGPLRVIGSPTGIERLGGADFDQQVFEHVRSLAGDAFADLDEQSPEAALALARVRRECTDAKEALSFDAETFVPVLLPGGQTRVRLVRSEFEQMIDDSLRRTVETLRGAVTSAGLEIDELSTVLLIGGSSRIPAVAQLISSEFELPVAIDTDPKASISLGAAVAASHRLPSEPGGDLSPEDAAESEPERRTGFVPALAPTGAGAAVLPAHRMSIGLRATVLAGVAAALLALLIPITPLAQGNQERDGNPEETTGGTTNGLGGGQYVTGVAPLPAGGALPVDDSTADDETPPALRAPEAADQTGIFRPAPSANPATSPTPTGSAAAPEDTTSSNSEPPGEVAPAAPADPSPSPEPQPTPVPEPEPTPVPVPEPEPTQEPDPAPAPEPATDVVSDPAPEPTSETQPVPEPVTDPAEPPTAVP